MIDQTRLSKFVSLVLRHEPGKIGVRELEPGGFVPVEALLAGLRRLGFPVSREDLDRLVRESPKQRFSFDASGGRIRCNQGHSVPVDLELSPAVPPDLLYHGTVDAALPAIRREGLRKMKGHAVHLSPDVATATIVGSRRGKAVVLTVDARAMHEAGFVFYVSANGVWLVDSVPAEFVGE